MSSSLQVLLSALLGSVLVALTAVCVVLWRRIHTLSRIVARPEARPVTIRLDPPPASFASRITVPLPSRPTATAMGARGDRAEEAGPTLIVVPSLATTPAPASGASAAMDRRFGDVWALADSGEPAGMIASRTGYPIGQVELILGLRRQLPAVAEAGTDA